MGDAEPRRATLAGHAGHGHTRCLAMINDAGDACGARPLRHILIREPSGEYVSTVVCHQHVAAAMDVEGVEDSHVWSTWRSSCADPVSVWVDSKGTGYGRCLPNEPDETDAELAELLQHDGGR
jgi:hypothetical protein